MLKLFLCFRYTIIESGQFGSLVDGQWNGIVGMVHRGVNTFTIVFSVLSLVSVRPDDRVDLQMGNEGLKTERI